MDSHHRFRRHPNLLKAGLGQIVASGPGQVFFGGGLTYRTPGQRSPPAWGVLLAHVWNTVLLERACPYSAAREREPKRR